MGPRILSTVLLWVLVIGSVSLGGATAAVWVLALFTAGTLLEFLSFHDGGSGRPLRWVGGLSAAACILAAHHFPGAHLPGIALILGLAVGLGIGLGRFPPDTLARALTSLAAGLLLIPGTFVFLVYVLSLGSPGSAASGLILALWLIVTAKFTDVGALVIGTLFGKHRLAPRISPLKSWEGVAGGILVAAAVSALFALAAGSSLPPGMSPGLAALLALPVAVAAVLADLLESALKRASGVKDSGRLIPGIGGIFDLTDSFVLVAPVGYFLLWLALGRENLPLP